MRLILLLTLALILPLTSLAQEQLIRQVYDPKSDTWAEVTSLFDRLPGHGYAPIRITINNGLKKDRAFSLSFISETGNTYGNDSGSRMLSSFSCSCSAGNQETFDFLVPVATLFKTSSYDNESQLRVTLSTSGFPDGHGIIDSEILDSFPAILLSDTLYVRNSSELNNELTSSSLHHSYSSGSLQFAGHFSADQMPSDWRAYLGQDIMMLTCDEWRQLDPGARTAILEWNRLGGELLLYSTNQSDNFNSLKINGTANKNTANDSPSAVRSVRRSLGRVLILPIETSNQLNIKETFSMVTGRHNPAASATPPTSRFNRHPLLAQQSSHHSILHDYAKNWPLQHLLGEKNFSTGFFIFILLLFGIVVGPVNLFVFAKSGKRHKLFITTPLISLATSALLVMLIIFQDGFGGQGERLLLMDIQPEENNAYIIQEQVARTGVLFGSSFETSEAALITPVALAPSRWTRVALDGTASANYTANHGSQGLDVSGDWFQSRSMHGHLLKTVRPSRATMTLSTQSNERVLVSTFDFPLHDIFYQDNDLNWWHAAQCPKGGSVTMKRGKPQQFEDWLRQQSERFSSRNSLYLKELTIQPGRFFAVTEEATGIDSFDAIEWQNTTTIITGPVSR